MCPYRFEYYTIISKSNTAKYLYSNLQNQWSKRKDTFTYSQNTRLRNNLMFLSQLNDIRKSERSVYLKAQVKKWKWLFRLSHHLPRGTEENQEKQILIFCWPFISIYLFININQLDALNFIISLFQASTCFEHMCSSSGGQNCIIQSLVSSHL